ncbi:quinol:cytochrome C oxidoreductase [Rhizosphaericola mali]|uniref:Quinol:cytochrome C oxidoreductase n=1 Tax=Rhizosphaericola mali TaxID=2545455 RepID=A0A5P2G938_9BACT|nr:quinol:cytochrome C oxidoreductase [Rhizosphaericola mali]QES90462.1 quinol:cytochrome C oxidoreductase [Rhizosphaericola mali]
MSTLKLQFEVPSKMKSWSIGLIVVGLIAVILGFVTKGSSKEASLSTQFWGTLMYNSIFFLLVCNAAMFFICATTLAMGGWQQSFKRVAEAISAVVPIFAVLTGLLLIGFVLTGNYHIYEWLNKDFVNSHEAVKGKSGFLSPGFFIVWTLLTLGLWVILGKNMRKISSEADEKPFGFEEGRKYIFRNTVAAALFIVWFALTVGSVTPWFWMMSIDAGWYSTMYSWYTFASSFVSGVALIILFVIYLKNKGYLEYTNQEHLHDLGKFMFAFSIFWTYLWFAQYMLLWYANIPEETIYFKKRIQTEYKGVFFLMLVINFVCPILILMKRSAKRNYTVLTFMAVLIIFGHWLDFYQMIMASLCNSEITLGWLDFGVAALYVGMIIFFVGKNLEKKPLIPRYHPFLKESIIHHT